MVRTCKVLTALTVVVGSFAVSACQALAVEGKGSGVTMTEIVLEGGGGTIKCPAETQTITYELQKPTKILEPNWEEQEFSNPAKAVRIVVKTPAEKCTATSPLFKGNASLSECVLILQDTSESSTNEVEALGSVVTNCDATVTAFGATCEIRVPRGKKVEEFNSELKKNWLKNSGTENLNVKATDSPILTSVNANCEAAGVKSTFEGKLRGELLLKGIIHL